MKHRRGRIYASPTTHKEDTMLKNRLLLTLTICAAASLSISRLAYAQISEFKIAASDGAADDMFGASVSISGNYAVMGAIRNDAVKMK